MALDTDRIVDRDLAVTDSIIGENIANAVRTSRDSEDRDGLRHLIWYSNASPIVSFRNKAFQHERELV